MKLTNIYTNPVNSTTNQKIPFVKNVCGVVIKCCTLLTLFCFYSLYVYVYICVCKCKCVSKTFICVYLSILLDIFLCVCVFLCEMFSFDDICCTSCYCIINEVNTFKGFYKYKPIK